MVTTKHCCYGSCRSDSRYQKDGVWFIGFGNGFPKPDKEKERCMLWVHNCGRRDFTIKNVTKDTYICSLHFVGGNGPTKAHPDPVKLGTIIQLKRKPPKSRVKLTSKRLKEDISLNSVLEDGEEGASTDMYGVRRGNDFSCQKTVEVQHVDVTVKPLVHEASTQTSIYVASETLQLRIQNKILHDDLKVTRSKLELFKSPPKGHEPNARNKNELPEGSVKRHEVFSIDKVKDDDSMFRFYTGLTYKMFQSLWQFLGASALKLNYWNSAVSEPEKRLSKQCGRKRIISPINELFLTLIRLRLGLLNADLAYRFGISTREVSTIVLTWTQFLYQSFKPLKRTMFASRHLVRKHLPKIFKKYENIRCIIDCTEVRVQQPRNFQSQGNVYSAYKSHTTFKFLVAAAPNGAIMFISDAFEGSISDKEIVVQSGLLDMLERGDQIMADREFCIKDILNERQISLIIPPFLRSRMKRTPQDESLTKDIAKRRIQFERSIERIKKFRLLRKVIPLSIQPVFSQCVFVIGCLVNFQNPHVQ
ncbi:hypothetical protein ACJMK2_036566 [Sinanodonta woodiana]|uniref:THAP-type domain-containing protein n=1 Tax=Sinanodonta woodiana TaxID=1069815 RepID=A0ABD3WIZ9_SINWO